MATKIDSQTFARNLYSAPSSETPFDRAFREQAEAEDAKFRHAQMQLQLEQEGQRPQPVTPESFVRSITRV